MAIDKNLLKKLNILYVEDDDVIRNELSQLLSNFFGHIYTAVDGKDGLTTYENNRKYIDIILTDINMPILNGIDMIKLIREDNDKIPIFFSTAHSDSEFLAQAIKLKVFEYIIKPIDVRKLLSTFSDLAQVLHQNELLEKQRKELSLYKQIVDTNNIVIKTDLSMNIIYVNEQFCKTTGFSKDELLGEDFKVLKHHDMSADIYSDIYASVANNRTWHGPLKNRTKENGSINVDAHVIATRDGSGEITGSISIQRDITDALNKKRDIQMALMKDKSDIFIKSKEGSAEQNVVINNLRNEIASMKEEYHKAINQKDKYIYTIEKYTVENRRLKTELAGYKKNADYVEERQGASMKMAKENADLRLELKKANLSVADAKDEQDRSLKQQRVNYEVKIDDLNEELNNLNTKLETMDSNEVLEQKLIYWKEKAKNESKRVESLEKDIIAHGDKNFMSKIFG
jgi:PAS domain S-box-containing protein